MTNIHLLWLMHTVIKQKRKNLNFKTNIKNCLVRSLYSFSLLLSSSASWKNPGMGFRTFQSAVSSKVVDAATRCPFQTYIHFRWPTIHVWTTINHPYSSIRTRKLWQNEILCNLEVQSHHGVFHQMWRIDWSKKKQKQFTKLSKK